MFTYIKFEPAPALKYCIYFYWLLQTGPLYKPVCAPLFADASTDIFANLGSSTAAFNQNCLMAPGRLYIGGTSTCAGFVNSLPDSTFVGIRFKPCGLHTIYKFPLTELVNNIIDFHDRRLSDLLDVDAGLPERLDKHFLYKLSGFPPPAAIAEVVLGAKGVISVDQLAQKCNVSSRTLERQAYSNLGIGPKEFIRIVRFQTVLKALQKMRTNGSMMQVAYQAGYYDPAHFTREVKKYSGLTPSAIFPGPRFP
jgi:AraC-like DNA-binding protein